MEKLIRETRWSKVYERDDGVRSVQSKFSTEGLSVAADELKRMWPEWDDRERLDFAQAFSQKASFSQDDCDSLEFLVQSGSDIVASATAIELATCPNSSVAFDLIVTRLGAAKNVPRSNFFQALGRLADQRGVAILEQLRASLAGQIAGEPTPIDTVIDYLSCCTALAELTKNSEYKRNIEAYLTDDREPVRFAARAMIENRLTQI